VYNLIAIASIYFKGLSGCKFSDAAVPFRREPLLVLFDAESAFPWNHDLQANENAMATIKPIEGRTVKPAPTNLLLY
jgi:hypothetical protein